MNEEKRDAIIDLFGANIDGKLKDAEDIVNGIIELAVQAATEQIEATLLKKITGCVTFDCGLEAENERLTGENVQLKKELKTWPVSAGNWRDAYYAAKEENEQLRAGGDWLYIRLNQLPEWAGLYQVAKRDIEGKTKTDFARYYPENRSWTDCGIYAWKPMPTPPSLEPPEVKECQK